MAKRITKPQQVVGSEPDFTGIFHRRFCCSEPSCDRRDRCGIDHFRDWHLTHLPNQRSRKLAVLDYRILVGKFDLAGIQCQCMAFFVVGESAHDAQSVGRLRLLHDGL